MKLKALAAAALLITAAACNQGQVANQSGNEVPVPAKTVPSPSPLPAEPDAAEHAAQPVGGTPMRDVTTSLAEPAGPIDPKSAGAAGQVVQHYGALIEQGRWSASWALWSDRGSAKAFDRNWRDDSDVHMEIGKPGKMEGAAGSSYVSVPVVFYGKKLSGGSFRKKASVTLRRVNDVPGSSVAQRRWHIERIESGAPA